MRNSILLLILSVLGTTFAQAQNNPYIRKEDLHNPQDRKIVPCPTDPLMPLPQWCWEGQRFIFLPAISSESPYYSILKGPSITDHPSYAEGVGRIGIIRNVSAGSLYWRAELHMQDTDQVYRIEQFVGSDTNDIAIDGLALVADLDYARKHYLGKSYWYYQDDMSDYDYQTQEFVSVQIPKGTKVKIVDVVAGWYHYSPVRLILETTEGKHGYHDIRVSGTNSGESLSTMGSDIKSVLSEKPLRNNRRSR